MALAHERDISTLKIGVLGAGTMGSGIAQVAAMSGHEVQLIDSKEPVLERAKDQITRAMSRLVEKGTCTRAKADQTLARISYSPDAHAVAQCHWIIEAIVEELTAKQGLFLNLESVISRDSILATNTSSLSVAAIAGACKFPERVLGVHFFNPAPLMPLVEIVPAIQTDPAVAKLSEALLKKFGKTTVVAKDTPGFIVNRIARPFYGEALRILEEGIADHATIDWALKEFGGFKMGPFELMDLIGNDINYRVTESVFEAFYYDPRYRPSLVQRRMVEAGYLGKKSVRGYYDYRPGAVAVEPRRDKALGQEIFHRVLAMLVNEAVDALFFKIASAQDIELAMTKGVNYPQGLLAWGTSFGLAKILKRLEHLQAEYGEDRYRPSPLLRRAVKEKKGLTSQ